MIKDWGENDQERREDCFAGQAVMALSSHAMQQGRPGQDTAALSVSASKENFDE